MKILFIGDIVGRVGRKLVSELLPAFKKEIGINFCVANGENAAGGFGITPDIFYEFRSLGIDVVTSGNHIWDRKEIMELISQEEHLLRPANYPSGVPGRGYNIFPAGENYCVGIINLAGRTYLPIVDCPFRVGAEIVNNVKSTTPIIIIDVHAEATSEKMALGWYFDGLVSAVVGTHTHVQTADERILPGGTAYITDIGMTGPHDSVIGFEKKMAIHRFITQMPGHFQVAKENPQFVGVILDIDPLSGKATRIERFRLKGNEEVVNDSNKD